MVSPKMVSPQNGDTRPSPPPPPPPLPSDATVCQNICLLSIRWYHKKTLAPQFEPIKKITFGIYLGGPRRVITPNYVKLVVC